jgi:hypothetical protein
MMNEDDQIRLLLTTADFDEKFAATAPPTVGELQARWSARRRRRLTVVGGVAAAVLTAWMALPRRDVAGPNPQAEVAREAEEDVEAGQMLRELARLDREADQALATARRLRTARQIEQARGEMVEYKPLAANDQIAAEQIDRTVMISVAHADRLRATLGDARPAVELYRHVLHLFPDSRWAAVARERIAAASAMN